MFNILKKSYDESEFATKNWKDYFLYVTHTAIIWGLTGAACYFFMNALLLLL